MIKKTEKSPYLGGEVGMRIREIRQTKGKTIEELANEAYVTKGTLSRFEKGWSPTSLNYALFLRNEYGISFDWIYEGETILKAHKSRGSKQDILDPMAIGARLKGLRESLGLNRVEFSKLTGMSNSVICQYEKGERTPRVETAMKIKQATQKPLDWIYFGDEIIVPKSVRRAEKLKKTG
ncbi:helix-turn-helix domain-containing protein [Candidatus Liberibacter sp.]|uniref:helix-turn-helix domain-containing protein n=1 Tax=Candidatus Liberibacter sp. TaxID=34022 RepID=UPI0015F65D34|nr:helix-turn-helix transcriptional regulator [Candidatus Liberibacter sp.]MBA5724611.1 helix-turn-helix transcriptional regulator [Candidatus Liberibacter sp.]